MGDELFGKSEVEAKPGAFSKLWQDVDRLAQKSEREFKDTKAHIESAPGWKFNGVQPPGVWTARHRVQGLISARTSAGLLAEFGRVQAEIEQWKKDHEARESERKARGQR